MRQRERPQPQIGRGVRHGAQHVLDGVYALRDELLRHAAVVTVLLSHLARLHALLVLLETYRQCYVDYI